MTAYRRVGLDEEKGWIHEDLNLARDKKEAIVISFGWVPRAPGGQISVEPLRTVRARQAERADQIILALSFMAVPVVLI